MVMREQLLNEAVKIVEEVVKSRELRSSILEKYKSIITEYIATVVSAYDAKKQTDSYVALRRNVAEYFLRMRIKEALEELRRGGAAHGSGVAEEDGKK